MHDPCTLNQQGHDRGTQYRSSIFYHDQDQKAEAIKMTEYAQQFFKTKIQTSIEEYSNYCVAEDYHQVF